MRSVLSVFEKIFPGFTFFLLFVYRNKYFPNIKRPRSFNEKINYRKKHWTDSSYVRLSDKLALKEYLAELSAHYSTPETYYKGKFIRKEDVVEILNKAGSCVAKANHNSGPVFLLNAASDDASIELACQSLNSQVTIDYGRASGETWYSDIVPQVFLEETLPVPLGDTLDDYKFHVFRQADGQQYVIIQVDFDRHQSHSRSFFDEDLNWLPFGVRYPMVRTKFPEIHNISEMIFAAKDLAHPFSYVRIDMYSTYGQFYVGEFTFAHGSGSEEFTTQAHDRWMGDLWAEFDSESP